MREIHPDRGRGDVVTAAIIRITGGNFLLLRRLLSQVERILRVNALSAVTPAVIDAAREDLVNGAARHTPGRAAVVAACADQ
jgi:hypothetical protein